jgi:hypothetical protein
MENLLYKNTAGILKHAMNCGDAAWKKLKKNTEPYYVRAENYYFGKPSYNERGNKRRRVLRLRFNVVQFLELVIREYNPFMSSWFDSFCMSGGFNPQMRDDNRGCFYDTIDRFISYINESTFGQLTVSKLDLDSRYSHVYHQGTLLSAFVNINAGESVYLSDMCNVESGLYMLCMLKRDNARGQTYAYNGQSYESWDTKLEGAHASMSSGMNTILVFKLKDNLRSLYGNYARVDNQRLAFQDMHYITGDLPADVDTNYNAQMWLPLLERTTNNESFYDCHPAPMYRDTKCLWSVGDIQSEVNGNVGIPVRFIGDYYTEGEYQKPLSNLSDYKLTHDESLCGKGVIYVDDDDICYCPHTGVAMQCVVDFRPMVESYNGVQRSVY